MQLKFLAGLPSGTRAFVTTRLPDANKEVKNPPTITQMIKIICDRFNPKSIESYGYESADDEDLPIIAKQPITTLTQKPTIKEPVALPNLSQTNSHGGKSNTRPDIDALAQQLQQLSLSQAQLMTMLSGINAQPSTNINSTSTDKRCFICGLVGTHRLHPRHCPETAKLLAEGLLVFLPARKRGDARIIFTGMIWPSVSLDEIRIASPAAQWCHWRTCAWYTSRGPTYMVSQSVQVHACRK